MGSDPLKIASEEIEKAISRLEAHNKSLQLEIARAHAMMAKNSQGIFSLTEAQKAIRSGEQWAEK